MKASSPRSTSGGLAKFPDTLQLILDDLWGGGLGASLRGTEVLGDSGGCGLARELRGTSTVILFRHGLNPCVCFHPGRKRSA